MALQETTGSGDDALKANGTKRPKGSPPPQLRMTAEKQKQRLKTLAKVRAADRVSSAFLFELPRQLELTTDILAKKLGISNPRFYYYRSKGFAPDFVLAKANALLREKGLPQIAAQPPSATPAPDKAVGGAGKVAFVSANFLAGLEEKLGVGSAALCALIGARESTLKTWRRTGECPVWVRAAVNGLLAERKAIAVSGERRAKKNVAATPDMETLIVSVPKDQVRMACAMFSACGFTFRSES